MKDLIHISVGTVGTSVSLFLEKYEQEFASVAALLTIIYMLFAIGGKVWRWLRTRKELPLIALSIISLSMIGCETPPQIIVKEERPDFTQTVTVMGSENTQVLPTVKTEWVDIGEGSFFQAKTYSSNVVFWIGGGIIVLGIGLVAVKKWFPLFPAHVGVVGVGVGLCVLFVPYVGEQFGIYLAFGFLAFAGVAGFYVFRPKPERKGKISQMEFSNA